MNYFIKSYCIIGLLLLNISCFGQLNIEQNSVDIYVCGYDDEGAKVWKNNELLYKLEGSGKPITANSIFVSDTNIYVVGWNYNGTANSFAALWVNGKYQALNKNSDKNGEFSAIAWSVFVKDTDVYAAGRKKIDKKPKQVPTMDGKMTTMYDTEDVAVIWKNGEEIVLPSKERRAEANSVFVTDSNVYVAGFDGDCAVLWKNGVKIELTNGRKRAQAQSIFVYNRDVYVVGYEQEIIYENGKPSLINQVSLWKNEKNITKYYKNSFQYGKDIFVYNNDIYIAGMIFNGKNFVASVQKNKENKLLANKKHRSAAASIYVLDNNVYVAGEGTSNSKRVPVLWVNGELHILPDSAYNGQATSVFVKKKE